MFHFWVWRGLGCRGDRGGKKGGEIGKGGMVKGKVRGGGLGAAEGKG